MVKFACSLNKLKKVKVLVAGDMMLDAYTFGKARRISPEAPVAIVNIQCEENRPGGAGNVILNLMSLGADVVGLSRVGADISGESILFALRKEKVDVRGVLQQERYATTVKRRVISDNQQIVRLDFEQIESLCPSLEQKIIDSLSDLLQDVDVIAVSDYGKGFLSNTLLSTLMSEATLRNIPVIVDPKGSDFSKYAGCEIIKPNLSEAYAAAKLPSSASLDAVAEKILSECEAKWLMITRSEEGISLFSKEGQRYDFPIHGREVKDVTGAGDTVLAMLAYAKANCLSNEEIVHLCNVAAGIAIEQVGCARISLSDIACRLVEHMETGKVFDSDHLFVLQEVLKQQPFVLCDFSLEKEFSFHLLQHIKQIASTRRSVVVCFDSAVGKESMIDFLSSIQEVSFIFVSPKSVETLCELLEPVAIYKAVAQECCDSGELSFSL